ncbi:FtsX-like permease family protein [Georgenia sunbinii]|uniref:FtsX-like permease family protein n=1 Tax=Georgenia sunbinii TaxID=3117728 RepID=UPI002F265EA8
MDAALLTPPSGGRSGTTLRIGLLLARRGGMRSSVLLLPAVAFATTTTLVLTVLAGAWSFLRWDDELAGSYQILAGLALALLVPPLLSLGGAAARLSARRRDDRLAGLRLLGATTAMVTRLTVLESAVVALLGGCAGVIGYLALGPLVQLVHFRGEPIGSAFWLPAWLVVCVVLAIVLLAAVSAVLGLRQVRISPLGVRRRQDPPRISWLWPAGGGAVMVLAVVAFQGSYADLAVFVAVIVGGFAACLAVLGLVGPWVVSVVARRRVRRAQRPDQLLAARAMAENPKAVWRQISGVVMTCFIAVVAGSGVALMGTAQGGGMAEADRLLVADIRTGILITIAVSFLMVACSTGVTQAAEVLDRAELYRNLDRLGMPRRTMTTAQTATVMTPLLVIATGTVLLSGLLVAPLAGMAVLLAPTSVAMILAALVLGVLLVRLAVLATRPLLTATLREAA